VKRTDFIELLKRHPEDYEVFCMIKDSIVLNGDYKDIGLKCYVCR
jgi:hypothetical protein